MKTKLMLDLEAFTTAPAFEGERGPEGTFDLTSERLRLGDLAVVYAGATAQRWAIDAAVLRSCGPDAIVITITLHGHLQGAVQGTMAAGAGTIQIIDLAKLPDLQPTASKAIHLIVPRELALRQRWDVATLHGVVLYSAAAGLLGFYLLAIRQAASHLSLETGTLLARGVLDLVGLALGAPPVEIGRSSLALAARAAIERELGSAGLNAAWLCRVLEISRSTLHRLFESDGGVQAYVLGRRLEAVRAVLADGDANEPLLALADRFGFSDSAHLSRSFRSRYEMSPTQFRALARNNQSPERP